MLADVSLVTFLSGGVDSSTIVALIQKQRGAPVRTFFIGFHEKKYNEAEYVAAVAAYLGTDYTEFYVTAKNALDIVPPLADIYDEPFADSSHILTALVMHMARQHVTVALWTMAAMSCSVAIRSIFGYAAGGPDSVAFPAKFTRRWAR